MSKYREDHQKAMDALEIAKQSNPYRLSKNTVLFKKSSKTGRVNVGYKVFGESTFRLVKAKDVTDLGVDINNLPDYDQFADEYRALMYAAESFLRIARAKSAAELKRAELTKYGDGGYTNPFYDARRKAYDDYMASSEWQKKRQEVFLHHGKTCIDCCKAVATDVHHLHYDTLGDECAKNDLVPLCSACHAARHQVVEL